jgi:hypothetical protein
MSHSKNFPGGQALYSTPRTERGACTPKTIIEAVVHSVRERGIAALNEPANIDRLLRCDNAAKTEINERIARLIAAKEIAA